MLGHRTIRLAIVLIAAVFFLNSATGQEGHLQDSAVNNVVWINKSVCKSFSLVDLGRILRKDVILFPHISQKPFLSAPASRKSAIVIKGTIQYDFLLQSYIDTPFAQNDFQQHTVQANLSVTVKDKYPFRVNFSQRINNSPYLRNTPGINLHFDRYAYLNRAKTKLLEEVAKRINGQPQREWNEILLKKELQKLNDLKINLKGPDLAQRLVEERERAYYKSLAPFEKPRTPEVTTLGVPNVTPRIAFQKPAVADVKDTLPAKVETVKEELDRKTKSYDSLLLRVQALQAKVDSSRSIGGQQLAALRKKIYGATSIGELQAIGLSQDIVSKPKGIEKVLAGMKSVGVGRSQVNYSELTAWNVSLTGLNIEYNPRIYTAFAIGKVDYGFRDFFKGAKERSAQSLAIVRIGIGDIDHKAIILTGFTGKKQRLGGFTPNDNGSFTNVIGYSLEGIYKWNRTTFISAEIGKTTKPYSDSFQKRETGSLWRLKDDSNLGVNIKGETFLPQTETRISGYFRKTGESFQSFSLFSYNTDQTSWNLKAGQPFLKNKIGLLAGLRRNDFISPFSEKTYKTSTVFKTVQLSVRVPKYPFLTLGFYPGSQLYLVDKEHIRENAYYILAGTLVHPYSLGGVRMVSSINYNRYDSKGTDSGFIAYSGKTYNASQRILFRKGGVQSGYTYTDQEEFQFFTLEGSADYSLRSYLSVGGSVKYNRVQQGEVYLGGQANLTLDIKRLGGLRLQYEKSHLPTTSKTLFPIEQGRLSWYKTF